jgi:hypothetical protein
MNMVEYYALMYANGKMRPAETIPGTGGRRDKGEWWTSMTIHCKNFDKCHNAPPVQQ